MVKLRLQRTGTKADPHYRIVAADIRSPRDGRFIEAVGHFHPTASAVKQSDFNEEKTLSWLKKGAQPTDTVLALLKKNGIWSKYKG
ncbi:30S ribosomal protein S16 [Leptospira kobayashii]|uniref:Small ribosomal subunit protein bS16 n=1 Tax=Leptospira kobayashii TaxID=1917830 RepID=A0ABN6KDB6_9LEPT|nr:30S ribosomal protein S16 [Leptospira kobayashii]BDA78923.1 30S ribosomal protein S16 [Leptospira kobayashii]